MAIKKMLGVLLIAITLSACAPGTDSYSSDDRAGFFSGVWHGWIAPVTLVWQIFDDEVRVYEPDNTGWFYDFGFYIAVISGFGSIRLFRRDKKD